MYLPGVCRYMVRVYACAASVCMCLYMHMQRLVRAYICTMAYICTARICMCMYIYACIAPCMCPYAWALYVPIYSRVCTPRVCAYIYAQQIRHVLTYAQHLYVQHVTCVTWRAVCGGARIRWRTSPRTATYSCHVLRGSCADCAVRIASRCACKWSFSWP